MFTNIKIFTKALSRAVRRGPVRAWAEETQKNAKRLVNSRSGRYKRNVKIVKKGDNTSVEAQVPYGGFLEEGTPKMKAQHILRRSSDMAIKKINNSGQSTRI